MDALREYLKAHPPKGFKPLPFYNEIGDILHLYVSDERCYAETLNEQVDVYRSMATGGVVGVKIWGARRLVAHKSDPYLVCI